MSNFGVATKAVIKNEDSKYLVIKKSDKEDINPETYDIPGGRMEFGEKLERALVREVEEETGLIVEPETVFEAWTFIQNGFQLVGINYLCNLKGGRLKLSEEHNDAKWMDYNEILNSKELPIWLKDTFKKAYKVESLPQ